MKIRRINERLDATARTVVGIVQIAGALLLTLPHYRTIGLSLLITTTLVSFAVMGYYKSQQLELARRSREDFAHKDQRRQNRGL